MNKALGGGLDHAIMLSTDDKGNYTLLFQPDRFPDSMDSHARSVIENFPNLHYMDGNKNNLASYPLTRAELMDFELLLHEKLTNSKRLVSKNIHGVRALSERSSKQKINHVWRRINEAMVKTKSPKAKNSDFNFRKLKSIVGFVPSKEGGFQIFINSDNLRGKDTSWFYSKTVDLVSPEIKSKLIDGMQLRGNQQYRSSELTYDEAVSWGLDLIDTLKSSVS